MAFPSKVTLLESSLFTFHHIEHLTISKYKLMIIYTSLIVNIKITMTTTSKNSIVILVLF